MLRTTVAYYVNYADFRELRIIQGEETLSPKELSKKLRGHKIEAGCCLSSVVGGPILITLFEEISC